MSREEVCLRPQFKRVLRLYGFDDPNSFLIDSCPESPLPITTAGAPAATTTTTTTQPMSVAAHGTVVTEMTPTSQSIQVSTNFTNNGSASEISTVTTDLPAKVTYVGDASFTISNIDTNTNQPMNLQTDTMVVDIETQPHVKPIESTTEQFGTKFSIGEQELKSTQIDTNPKEFSVTETIVTSTSVITSTDPLIEANTMMQTNEENGSSSSSVNSSQINRLIDKTNNTESRTGTTETTTSLLPESTTDAISLSSNVTEFNANEETILPSDSFATSTENKSDITDMTSTENALRTNPDIDFNDPNKANENYATMFTTQKAMTDVYETTLNIATDSAAEIIASTKRMPADDGDTAAIEMNTISAKVSDRPTSTVKFESSDDGITTENVDLTTDPSLMAITSSNSIENEVIKEAESNQHYRIASVENKNARSIESTDNLPTFNVEFVVNKKDLLANCNRTRKITYIKPERILTEYPENSGISIGLRNSKKRRKRYLEQCKFKHIQCVFLTMYKTRYEIFYISYIL